MTNDRRLYYVWKAMKSRCLNSKDKSFLYYGGRGITICEEWLVFSVFENWALSNGYTEGLQLDREDNSAGYSPLNCRWVTRSKNMNNTRKALILEAFGESKTLQEWFEDERCGVSSYNTLYSRITSGLNPEYAITTKAGPSGQRYATQDN